jgi:DNA-binding NtrC family response regulator
MGQEHPKILVVDDEPNICWALENALRPAGFDVITTQKGSRALELIAQETPVAVFLDAKLPDLDGLQLAPTIRRRSPRTAVILISGYFYEKDEAITEGLQEDLFAGFVAKPFDLDEVRSLARQAVTRAQEEEDDAESTDPGCR